MKRVRESMDFKSDFDESEKDEIRELCSSSTRPTQRLDDLGMLKLKLKRVVVHGEQLRGLATINCRKQIKDILEDPFRGDAPEFRHLSRAQLKQELKIRGIRGIQCRRGEANVWVTLSKLSKREMADIMNLCLNKTDYKPEVPVDQLSSETIPDTPAKKKRKIVRIITALQSYKQALNQANDRLINSLICVLNL